MDNRLSDTEREGVMRRVQKLLAIAQDSRANEHEAAAAAMQAEKIMRKYQLDHAQVISSRLKQGDDLAEASVVATAKDNGTRTEKVPVWCGWLSGSIAALYDCERRYKWVTTAKGQEMATIFYGYSADVQVAAWTFDYLVATVNRLCKAFRADPRYAQGGRPVMNAYRLGMVTGIQSSLNALKLEKDREVQAAVASRALVVVKQNAIVEKYGDFTYRKPTKTEIRDDEAFLAGRAVGKKVDVNVRGVKHDGGNKPLLKGE